MPIWDAQHYLKYGDERTRAAADLLARVNLDSPKSIADLGCGPGNSTHLLHQRWPDAEIVGVDSSEEMLATARNDSPDHSWELADIAKWQPAESYDLIYANAALMWLKNHEELMPRLFSFVADGGAFAFQIPSSTYALVRTILHDVSRKDPWNETLADARDSLTMHPPSTYYDLLIQESDTMDIWETEYNHVMESKDAVVDWIASSGMRPFMEALANDAERSSFREEFSRQVHDSYQSRVDGKVLFPFLRTFVIAYRRRKS